MNSFAVVILAAGRSMRMKRHKLLLPWEDTTILGHLIRTWQSLYATEIGVVVANNNYPVRAELQMPEYKGIHTILNDLPSGEMFDSILCASSWIGWQPKVSHWVVALGDQPQIQADTLRELLHFSFRNKDKICHPCYEGRILYPLIFPRWAWPQLRLMPRYQSIQEFLLEHEPACAKFECHIPELTQDIDYPIDYLRATKPA
jgi:molybdenum cofactor cytidylyltransferase